MGVGVGRGRKQLVAFYKLSKYNGAARVVELGGCLRSGNRGIFLAGRPASFIERSRVFEGFVSSPGGGRFSCHTLSLLYTSSEIRRSGERVGGGLGRNCVMVDSQCFCSYLTGLRTENFRDSR